MKKITAGILSVGLILLMVFSSSVLASPEAEDSLIGVAIEGMWKMKEICQNRKEGWSQVPKL